MIFKSINLIKRSPEIGFKNYEVHDMILSLERIKLTSKDLWAASALLKNSSMDVFSVMETGAEIMRNTYSSFIIQTDNYINKLV